jgi:serine/threonine protein kinase
MQRGPPHIDNKTVREIVNHRMLNHPNVVRFLEVRGLAMECKTNALRNGSCPTTPMARTHFLLGSCSPTLSALPPTPPATAPVALQVFLTPTHLGIAMEYCAGGELLGHIIKGGRLPEDVARYFFQQLISGVDYCHRSVGDGEADIMLWQRRMLCAEATRVRKRVQGQRGTDTAQA